MSERRASANPGRIGIIDLGSNSLRLAIFERHGAALFPVLNEKVMCGLARGIGTSGRLNRDGVALALVNLKRFTALAAAVGVDDLTVLATAAVRDASDGRAFADEVARNCHVPVEIIDGAEEARLAAAGVLAGIPDAVGIVADLGGGSIELVRVGPQGSGARSGAAGIGRGISLPLGPLRLSDLDGSSRTVADVIDRVLAAAPSMRAATGQSLYLVGGAARAIARLHMEHAKYPLHIVHHYTMGRDETDRFFDLVSRQSRKSLEQITTVSRKRLELVPLAALILRRLLLAIAPQRVVFSAYGLREGYASGFVPADEGERDPLIAACIRIAQTESRFPPVGNRLADWTAALFPGLPEAARRLHRAACWLGDFAWIEHPDYRAQEAFNRSLRLPFAAITHSERVFVASVLHTRYGGSADDAIREPMQPLIDPEIAGRVRTLGLALRLAYTLTGGRIERLADSWLGLERRNLVLEAPPDDGLFDGETVQRRLDAVARSIGAPAVLRRRERRRLAGD
jgi:exopolyphosphatase / guanosine-5'-triphosphate,3'-diphosphate pyrophosphatase